MLFIILFTLVAINIIYNTYYRYFRKKQSFEGKNCLITGGSSGLGKALAIELSKLGANVTIAARSEQPLKDTVMDLVKNRKNDSQNFQYICADVTKETEAIKMFEDIPCPDYVFTCAGAAKPGKFIEQPTKDFEDGMQLNYFGTLYVLKAAAKRMKSTNTQGTLAMTSSTAGYLSFYGYSQYSPSKYALRALADCLRQELSEFGIKVHCYFVSTIDTPGYQKECETKPAITHAIEGPPDSNSSPEQRAKTFIKGILNDEFCITSDFLTDVLRVTSHGCQPTNYLVWDLAISHFGWFITLPFSLYMDFLTRRKKKTE